MEHALLEVVMYPAKSEALSGKVDLFEAWNLTYIICKELLLIWVILQH